MSATQNYSQRTIAQLTETVLGESMSIDGLFDYLMREEFAPGGADRESVATCPPVRARPTTGEQDTAPLSEVEIRGVLRAAVAAASGEHIVGAVEEFWVPELHVRADLVVIGTDLHAYEIKSHADTLKRLPRQVTGFSSLFDRCSLVMAPRHLDSAMGQLPDWWGVAVAEGEGLDWVRRAGPNPAVDVERVVRLLWRDEVLSMLQDAGIAPDFVGGRAGMWRQALAAFDSVTIRATVTRALACRAAWKQENGRSRFTATPRPVH